MKSLVSEFPSNTSDLVGETAGLMSRFSTRNEPRAVHSASDAEQLLGC